MGCNWSWPQFVPIIPFDSTKHYEDYIARLHQIPRLMDQMIEVLQQGVRDKLMPPRFLLEKTVDQCKSIAEPAGEANVFGQPATRIPETIPAADRKRLHDAIVAAVEALKYALHTQNWRTILRRIMRRMAEQSLAYGLCRMGMPVTVSQSAS